MSAQTLSALWPLAWVLGGILAGLIAYVTILRPLQRAGETQGWTALSAISSILGSVVVLWGALAGLYVGLDRVALSPRAAAFADRGMTVIFVLSLTWIAARLAAASITSFNRRTEHRLFSVSLSSTLVQSAILIIGLLTVFGSLGIAIAPLLTTLGLGGLAVALALNDTLTNLFAGVHIVAARQIRVGDYVKFDFAEGQVTDIQWHNTTIRDLQNDLIVIPNAKVNTSVFTNYSMGAARVIVPVTAALAWKGPYAQLQQIAKAAAADAIRDAGQQQNADCDVLLTALNETNVQVTAYLPVDRVRDRMQAISSFLQRLHDGAVAANMGQSPQGHATG